MRKRELFWGEDNKPGEEFEGEGEEPERRKAPRRRRLHYIWSSPNVPFSKTNTQ